VAAELEAELEGRTALVIFAQHLAVLDIMESALSRFGVARIDGSTPAKERVRLIDAFQRPDGPLVFLGQLQACGTAITLTRAHHVVFVEQSWVPDENIQAAKRCHRIGQRDAVIARAFSRSGSLDDLIARAISVKIRNRIEIGEYDDEHDDDVCS